MIINTQKIIIFTTSVIIGLLMFYQYTAYKKIGVAEIREPESNIFRVINIYLKTNQNLKNEINKLSQEIANYQSEYTRIKSFQNTIGQNKLLAGEIKVQGKGIKLTLTKTIDTMGMVDLTNELWTAGAEIIAINGIRLTETTGGFANFGSQMTLNGIPLTPPLLIEVIGENNHIIQALEQSGGIISRLQKKDPQLKINLQNIENIVIEKETS